jgi:ribosomal protein S18 acetylase RimI-like enzyme
MHSGLNLRFLRPADWWTLRDARLAALQDSPHAFTSHYGHERWWTEKDWRRSLKSSTWMVAQAAGEAAGLARSVREPGIPRARNLESIWVAPSYRHQGVCRDLVRALAKRERRMGATQLLLWVLDGDHDALRAYEALGFRPMGGPQFLRAFGRWEQRLGVQISCLRQPVPTAGSLSLNRGSPKLSNGPIFQPQETHPLPGAPNVVYGVRELLPVGEVLSPSVDEVHAEIVRDLA